MSKFDRPQRSDHDAEQTSSWPIVPEITDPAAQLPGCIWFLKNAELAIENLRTSDHPAACVHVDEDRLDVCLSRGSDADNSRGPGLRVAPDEGNGLQKVTFFRFAPRWLRLHVVRRSHASRYCGSLTDSQLLTLRRGMRRALDPQRGHER